MDMPIAAADRLSASLHQQLIADHTPDWLLKATPGTREALRQSAGQALQQPWLNTARRDLAHVLSQLQAAHAVHRACQQRIAPYLDTLGTLEAFAAPRLATAIQTRFGMPLEVRTTYLFHASHVQADTSFMGASKDPAVQAGTALEAATRSLLGAALQNFPVEDTTPGALDAGTRLKARIFASPQAPHPAGAHSQVEIVPHEFAAMARRLDLGGRYQKHIDEVFDVQAAGHFRDFEHSTLQLQIHLAYLQQGIDEAMHGALLQLLDGQDARIGGQPLTCSVLRLWDVELSGVLLFGTDREHASSVQPVVVYIPEDPIAPLMTYPSAQDFHNTLRQRLFNQDYSQFFSRLMPARQRSQLLDKLQAQLFPMVKQGRWFEQQWLMQQANPHARLRIGETRIKRPLSEALYLRKLALIKDNARFQGVPTAEQDQLSREQRLAWWANAAVNTLNLAAFVVPVLGAVMLTVTAAQLCYEVYEGIEAWENDDREQALGYLFDVVENIALMAALAGASSAAMPIPAIEAPAVIDGLSPVQLASGKTRLWKPDLAPFAHDIVLPANLQPDALGLYHYQGRQWLPIEGQTYAVATGASGEPVMLPVSDASDLQPALRHNGAGAWLHALDNPRCMEAVQLMRRLGYDAATFSDEALGHLLQISGTREAALRRSLENLEHPAALLADCAQRWKLAHQDLPEHFEVYYQGLQVSDIEGVERLQSALPARLPRVVAEELWRHADSAEQQRVLEGGKLPERLSHEARHYRHQVRLARAYEGLYLDAVRNPDTDTLILHSLEHLPGWSADVRLEIRDGHFAGPLLDSVGAEDAPIRKVLVKDEGGYMARDADDQHLNGRADLYASVLHALPDAQRRALGIPNTGQRADLQRAIQAQPLPRHLLRKALRMAPVKPGFNSPMRLADGRIGYPLSGRPSGHWTLTSPHLLDKLSLLEFDQLWPAEMLERLHGAGLSLEAIDARLDVLLNEQQALRTSLDAWTEQIHGLEPARQADRLRIAEQMRQYWTRHSLPELGFDDRPLRLESFALEDFPEHLPGFFEQGVNALQLHDVRTTSVTGLIDGPGLERLLSRFGYSRSLSLSHDPALPEAARYLPGLLGRVSRAMPHLHHLALIDQQLWLDQAEMDGLLPLQRLRTLDLSGNRFSQQSSLNLDWLRPQRLVLERTDLRHWPLWLDTRVPGPIHEVSLAYNRLTELPDYILDNPYSADNRSVIDVRGNPLSTWVIMRARLDQGLADRSFTFRVDTPAALEANLGILYSERDALSEAIAGWREASSSQAPLTEQRIAQRQRIGLALMDYWRAYARGETYTSLLLEEVDLAEFPRRLPEFFYLRVRSLRLHQVTLSTEQLNGMLGQFHQLNSLRLSGPMTILPEPPEMLVSLRGFKTLSLTDLGLRIDQRWMEFFGRLPQMEHLELDGNHLGDIQNASALSSLNLRWLSLRNSGLTSWPAWLLELLPMPLETLILDGNQLQDIPQTLLDNPRRIWGHSEISLRENPLTHEVMLQAHTSHHYGRSYSFEIDLPQDIREITWYESHDSDSTAGESDFSAHLHSPSTSPSSEVSSVEPWLDNDAGRQATWHQLEETSDARNLLDLVGYLQRSADYRTPSSRPHLIERVWRVLDAAAANPTLRVTLDAVAEEPLALIRGDDTCPDGVMVEFNQMEVLVFTEQSLQQLPSEDRGTALLTLTRRLYRLHELDRIAREQAGARDEAEVRLAYRLHWAQALELPVPPQRMLYEAHARLEPDELDNALRRVQAGERGDAFLDFAITQTPWGNYLREQYPTGFAALQQAYGDNLNRLTERYEQQGLSLNSPEFESEARQLDHEYKEEQATLLKALTTESLFS